MTTLALAKTVAERQARDRDRILRFRRSERLLHWAIAIPFMVCYATAVTLVVVYNPGPARPFHALFSWLHRISGICLTVLPPLTIAWHWRDLGLHARNILCVWTWTRADVKWLLLVGPASLGARVTLPDQEKFNAGEKINFMMLTATYPVYIVSGIMILLPGIAYTSWLVHVCTAIFIATPLMLGHIFMAVVNPDTRPGLRGMLSGFVDREWARHHYRIWYDDLFPGEARRVEPMRSRVPTWLTGTDDELVETAMAAAPTGTES